MQTGRSVVPRWGDRRAGYRVGRLPTAPGLCFNKDTCRECPFQDLTLGHAFLNLRQPPADSAGA